MARYASLMVLLEREAEAIPLLSEGLAVASKT